MTSALDSVLSLPLLTSISSFLSKQDHYRFGLACKTTLKAIESPFSFPDSIEINFGWPAHVITALRPRALRVYRRSALDLEMLSAMTRLQSLVLDSWSLTKPQCEL